MCLRKQTPGFIEIFHSVVLTKLFNQKDYVLPQGKTTQKDYVLPQGKTTQKDYVLPQGKL